MSPGAVLNIVDATLDAAVSGRPDPRARLDAVLPILVRAVLRAAALLREAHPELTRDEAVARALDRAAVAAIRGEGRAAGGPT